MVLLEHAAKQGHSGAELELAKWTDTGYGETPGDPERAVLLFDEFCHRYMESDSDSEEGLRVLEAAYYLGCAHSTGRGVQQSWEQAVKCWEKVRALAS